MEGISVIFGGDDRDVGGSVLTFGGGLFRLEVFCKIEEGPGCWSEVEGAICWIVDEGVEGNSLGVAYSLFGDAKSRLRTSVEGSLLWMKAPR